MNERMKESKCEGKNVGKDIREEVGKDVRKKVGKDV